MIIFIFPREKPFFLADQANLQSTWNKALHSFGLFSFPPDICCLQLWRHIKMEPHKKHTISQREELKSNRLLSLSFSLLAFLFRVEKKKTLFGNSRWITTMGSEYQWVWHFLDTSNVFEILWCIQRRTKSWLMLSK